MVTFTPMAYGRQILIYACIGTPVKDDRKTSVVPNGHDGRQIMGKEREGRREKKERERGKRKRGKEKMKKINVFFQTEKNLRTSRCHLVQKMHLEELNKNSAGSLCVGTTEMA